MIREADCCGKVSAGHQLALRLEEAGNGGWRKAVEVVETHLRQKALVVTVVMGTQGLGLFPKSQVWSERSNATEPWNKVQAGVEVENVSSGGALIARSMDKMGGDPPAQGHLGTLPVQLGSGQVSIFSAAAQRLWQTAAICGITTRCWRRWLRVLASAISTSKHHHALKKTISFVKPAVFLFLYSLPLNYSHSLFLFSRPSSADSSTFSPVFNSWFPLHGIFPGNVTFSSLTINVWFLQWMKEASKCEILKIQMLPRFLAGDIFL